MVKNGNYRGIGNWAGTGIWDRIKMQIKKAKILRVTCAAGSDVTGWYDTLIRNRGEQWHGRSKRVKETNPFRKKQFFEATILIIYTQSYTVNDDGCVIAEWSACLGQSWHFVVRHFLYRDYNKWFWLSKVYFTFAVFKRRLHWFSFFFFSRLLYISSLLAIQTINHWFHTVLKLYENENVCFN